jgi:DNA-binding transcriptional LysR family regulator
MNRFAELETFVAVVETGSLSAAATRLGIAVSAVSRRVGELETRLGVRLANRSTRGFAPTAQGQAYYERCVQLLADLADADASTGSAQAGATGLLRIAAPMTFGVQHLEPVLHDFAASREQMRFEVRLDDHRTDLVEDGYDLAVRIGELEDSRLVARKLFDVNVVIAASPAFWRRHGKPQQARDLAGLPALAHRPPSRERGWKYTGRGGRVQVQSRYTANNGELLCQAAQRHLGMVCLPTFIVADAVHCGKLECVLRDHRWQQVSAWIVYPQGRPLPAYARDFIDYLLDTWTDPLPWDQLVDG